MIWLKKGGEPGVSLGSRKRGGTCLGASYRDRECAGAKALRQELQVDLQNRKAGGVRVRYQGGGGGGGHGGGVKDEDGRPCCALDRAMNTCWLVFCPRSYTKSQRGTEEMSPAFGEQGAGGAGVEDTSGVPWGP